MTDVTERYAAPTASVALEPPPMRLWRRSLWLMVLFMFLTIGFYPAIWLYRRRHALNAIDSAHKISGWPPMLLIGLGVVEFVAGIVREIANPGVRVPGLLEGAAAIVRVGVGIILLIQMFFVKSILEDCRDEQAGDTTGFSSSDRKLSGLMTFFFSVFYLQYIINRDIVGPRR